MRYRALQYDDGLDADGHTRGSIDADGYSVRTHDAWRFVHGCERDAGENFEWSTLSGGGASAVERIRLICNVSPDCESPIEVQLGAAILMKFEREGKRLFLAKSFSLEKAPRGLLLVPQFRWLRYRSDWAIMDARSPGALLIECDGKQWHTSPEQISRDATKDAAALDYGYVTLRFTGTDIHWDADGCATKVFDAVCGGGG